MEETEKCDPDAELVEQYAEAHPGDSEEEEVLREPMPSSELQSSGPARTVGEQSISVAVNKHLLEAALTPTDSPRGGFPERDLAEGQMLDDTKVAERSPCNQGLSLARMWPTFPNDPCDFLRIRFAWLS